MSIDFSDDLAVFFDPEEHGEAIKYNGAPGFSALWNRPTSDLALNGNTVVVDTNIFMLPVTQVAAPVIGDTIMVVRTGDTYTIDAEPRSNADGTIWSCEVA